MAITCPGCNNQMRSVIYYGASSTFCLACKCFFLKPEQLEQITVNSNIDLDTEAPKILPGGGEPSYHCPGCHSSMSRHLRGRILKTEVDTCDSCKSVWLNKTALTRIEYDAAVVRRNQQKNSGTRMTCPKCGLEQNKAESCKRCQVVVDKYRVARQEGRLEYRKIGFFEKLGKQLEARILETRQKSKHAHSRTRKFLDACQHNQFAFYLMKLFSWALIVVAVYEVWLIILYTFSNISMAPPRPENFDLATARVSIFYIFAIAFAGPIVLLITFILWRLSWYSMYGPIQALTHRFFHPLIKPVIAILLLMMVLQSVSLFAHGFWTTYWWLNQQVAQAKTQQL